MAGYLCDFLMENNFPDPGNYQDSATSYLESVANDNETPIEIRLRSAAELGVMSSYIAQMKLSVHAQLSMAYEDAIENYKNHIALKSKYK